MLLHFSTSIYGINLYMPSSNHGFDHKQHVQHSHTHTRRTHTHAYIYVIGSGKMVAKWEPVYILQIQLHDQAYQLAERAEYGDVQKNLVTLIF